VNFNAAMRLYRIIKKGSCCRLPAPAVQRLRHLADLFRARGRRELRDPNGETAYAKCLAEKPAQPTFGR